MEKVTRISAVVSGKVQGVGFRWFVKTAADELGIDGWVGNLPDGTVEIDAQGDEKIVARFLKEIINARPPAVVSNAETVRKEINRTLNRGFLIKS